MTNTTAIEKVAPMVKDELEKLLKDIPSFGKVGLIFTFHDFNLVKIERLKESSYKI